MKMWSFVLEGLSASTEDCVVLAEEHTVGCELRTKPFCVIWGLDVPVLVSEGTQGI